MMLGGIVSGGEKDGSQVSEWTKKVHRDGPGDVWTNACGGPFPPSIIPQGSERVFLAPAYYVKSERHAADVLRKHFLVREGAGLYTLLDYEFGQGHPLLPMQRGMAPLT
jgi:hypothetical protein